MEIVEGWGVKPVNSPWYRMNIFWAYSLFSHDVMAVIFVYKTMKHRLVYQENPVFQLLGVKENKTLVPQRVMNAYVLVKEPKKERTQLMPAVKNQPYKTC